MIEFLRNWVTNIVSLVIFLILLEILIPSGKIKKFINLISGFILMIALINPFLGFLKKDMDLKSFQFSDSNYLDKKDIEEKSKIMEAKQMKQITEVYREKIIKQLEESVKGAGGISYVKADVIINEDYKSEAFGEIKRVYLSIKTEDGKSSIKPVQMVEKVNLNRNKNIENEGKKISSEVRSRIEDSVVKFLSIKKENIVITYEEG